MEDKKKLYDEAKEAYYNGEPIMSDLEFDQLESELGLENNSYVGTYHKKDYTVKHPFLMGSLSKVQVKFDDDNKIDFKKYSLEVEKYLSKSLDKGECGFETSPKLDGVSFEVVANHRGELISVSTRGDGEYGKDVKIWFEPEWEKNYVPKFRNWIDRFKGDDEDSYMFLDKFVIRGEILVRKDVFMSKYSQDFTIPRTFVSGVINQDWEGTPKQIEMRNDLCWICYDYREVYENGSVFEIDYGYSFPGVQIDFRRSYNKDYFHKGFETIYKNYEDYRWNKSPFELDGIVVKPITEFRLQDLSRIRPEDCVAIKFTPEIVETQIKKIEWKVGKSGEYFPTAVCEEVIIGGKKVSRVSLHNLDYIVKNCIGDGMIGVEPSKIQISLAGDIIPFVYKVVSKCDVYSIPPDSYRVWDDKTKNLHLMKNMSDGEKMFVKFINSVKVLKPNGIGEKVAEKLYFEVKRTDNILDFMNQDTISNIVDILGDSKSTQNIIDSLLERKKSLNLPDVIESCGFENCGPKNSLWLAKKMSGINVSNEGIPSTIIELFESNGLSVIEKYVELYNIPMLKEEKTDKIPVIMTGEPSNTSFKTKKLWLQAHPQYIETSSFKECKILFTNDLESNSGKMVKARKKGIEIRLYEE